MGLHASFTTTLFTIGLEARIEVEYTNDILDDLEA